MTATPVALVGSAEYRVDQIAVMLGRTPRRVQQLIAGECVVEALPADLVNGRGRGYYLTSAQSFGAWLDAWASAEKW